MESKSILGVTSMCSKSYTIPIGHTEDDTAFLCSCYMLPFLLKCKTKFLEKYKGSLIFGSAYISILSIQNIKNQDNLRNQA